MEFPTLAEIKTAVRGLLQDDQFDDDLLTQAANWFQYELFNDTRTRLMETSDLVTAPAGSTEVEYPSDYMTRIGIYVTAPRVFPLSRSLEYESFMNSYADFATVTPREASAWTDYGMAMRFAAPLNVEHKFQIDYLREPTPMEQDSDDSEIPRRYMELQTLGTLARAMEINEDRAEAADVRDLMASQLVTFKRNEGRGGGKTGPASVMRTNRRRFSTGNPFDDGLRG